MKAESSIISVNYYKIINIEIQSIHTHLRMMQEKIFTRQYKWLVIKRTSQRFLLKIKSDSSI